MVKSMIRKIAIVLNARKPKTFPLKEKIETFIRKQGLEILDELEVGREHAVSGGDLIITLGGDGTLLNIVKYLNKKITSVIGVNVGDFGFLTEVCPDEILQVLEETLAGRSYFSLRSLLKISLYRENKKMQVFKALNDVVVARGTGSRIITLRLDINRKLVTSYFCDGLIVATATGSTAHSLSAGGPIIHPSTKALVISPICPHTLSNRPLVVGEDARISIFPAGAEIKETILTIDGQEFVRLGEKDGVEIMRHPDKIKLISSGKRDYFEILRQKLKWGGMH